jgi:hypothetical protein
MNGMSKVSFSFVLRRTMNVIGVDTPSTQGDRIVSLGSPLQAHPQATVSIIFTKLRFI